MTRTPFELLRAAEGLLSRWVRLRRGEEVLITTDIATDERVAKALMAAAERLGARALISMGAQLPFQGKLADPYISKAQAQLVKSCDVWVDLTFPYMAGSHVHDEAMQTKAVRYLLGGDMHADAFYRLFGEFDLERYFDVQDAFDAVFKAAVGKRCRITCPLGTDVSFKIGKYGLGKPRHAEKPGMYVVPGTCSIAPDVPTVKGKIVVTASFHEFFERLASPITLTLDGRIRSLSGGGASRFPLERALLRAGGGEYGSVIHFTHGLHPAARLTGTSFIEDIRAVGSNAVGLGIPFWEPGGGENHPDALLTEHSVWLEDEKIIEDGVIVAPGPLAERARQLVSKK